MTSSTSTVLRVEGLVAGYGTAVLHGISLEVRRSEVVGLFGANGAGKTTALLAIAGGLQPTDGVVELAGEAVVSAMHHRIRAGMAYVTETRAVFSSLSVLDNLRLGQGAPPRAFELFPELHALRNRRGGLLSGGEQQMLSLARALAAQPRLLLVDELSLGLAPLIVERLLEAIRTAADSNGMGALIVEQHVDKALRFVDRAYVLRRGTMDFTGTAADMRSSTVALADSYLGRTTEGEAP